MSAAEALAQVISLVRGATPSLDVTPFACEADSDGPVLALEELDGDAALRRFDVEVVELPIDELIHSLGPKLWSSRWAVRVVYPLGGDLVRARAMALADAVEIEKVLANPASHTSGIDNLYFEADAPPRYDPFPDPEEPRSMALILPFRVEYWE